MNPNFNAVAGPEKETALLLLAPSVAALSALEFVVLCEAIKGASMTALADAYDSLEKPGAMCVTAQMLTRFGATPGMSEAQEIMSLACRYMDTDRVMPPSVAKWEKAWWVNLLQGLGADAAATWADDVQDAYNKLVLTTSKEYTVSNPPELLGSPQSAGLRSGLYAVLTLNVEAYTDEDVEAAAEEQGVSVSTVAATATAAGVGTVLLSNADSLTGLASKGAGLAGKAVKFFRK